MTVPDIIELLSTTRWTDVRSCLVRHEHELLLIDPGHDHLSTTDPFSAESPSTDVGPPAGVEPPVPTGAAPGPTATDAWILVRLTALGGVDLALHHVTFARSSSALDLATSAEDLEDLLTESLISGLIVTDALGHGILVERLVELAETAEHLEHPSTQLMALVATARSTAFDLTGDVIHADASIDAFRAVIAPPDGLGPLTDSGLTGARTALALVLAARDRATTSTGSGHHDLLEAIAIARASANLDPPLDEEDELAANTLLTLLAELFQVTGDLAVVDDALAVLDRIADVPPTVAQLAARVLWLQLRHERSGDADDLIRALLTVDDALTRAVTDEPGTNDPADVAWLRSARRHILLALSDLRKPPDHGP